MSIIDTASRNSTRLILIGAARAAQPRHGAAPEPRPVPDAGDARPRASTAADFTLALAIQNIVWGLSQAPVGAIADRFGLRVTMIAGAVIYVSGSAVMAAAGGAAALLVSGALIGVALSCTASSLAMTACARAVSEERRSKMLGIVSAGGSLGTLMVPLDDAEPAGAARPGRSARCSSSRWPPRCSRPAFLAGGADKMPAARRRPRRRCARCSARRCGIAGFS